MQQQVEPRPDAALRPAKLAIVATVGLVILLTLILGSLPMKVLALVMGLCTLQGLWRGAIELAGLVLGMIVAVILARPLGIAFEGAAASIFNTSGLMNRGLSMAIVALVITALIAIIFKFTAGRALKKKEPIARYDKLAGAALGLIEGSIIGLMLLWVPLALEPVATAQLAARQADPTMPANPAAERVVSFAHQVRASTLGGVATSTNPAGGSMLLSLANEAAAVLRDPEKFEHLMQDDAIVRLQALDSFKRAMDMMNTDPRIARLLDAGEINDAVIRELAESNTMLRIMDDTTLLADVRPLVEDLRKAIADAAAARPEGE